MYYTTFRRKKEKIKKPEAEVAELADARDSKSRDSNIIRVQLPSSAPVRKLQARGIRLASLGGQFVLNFRDKNELAIF